MYRSRAERGEPATPAPKKPRRCHPLILLEKREAAIRLRAGGRGYGSIAKALSVAPKQAKEWWDGIGRPEQDLLAKEAHKAEGVRIAEAESLRRPMARTLAIFNALLDRIEQDVSDDVKMRMTSLRDKVVSLVELIKEYRRVPNLGRELDEALAASLVKDALVDRALNGDVDAQKAFLQAVDPAFKKEVSASPNITIIADKVLAMTPEQRRAHSAQLMNELTQ